MEKSFAQLPPQYLGYGSARSCLSFDVKPPLSALLLSGSMGFRVWLNSNCPGESALLLLD